MKNKDKKVEFGASSQTMDFGAPNNAAGHIILGKPTNSLRKRFLAAALALAGLGGAYLALQNNFKDIASTAIRSGKGFVLSRAIDVRVDNIDYQISSTKLDGQHGILIDPSTMTETYKGNTLYASKESIIYVGENTDKRVVVGTKSKHPVQYIVDARDMIKKSPRRKIVESETQTTVSPIGDKSYERYVVDRSKLEELTASSNYVFVYANIPLVLPKESKTVRQLAIVKRADVHRIDASPKLRVVSVGGSFFVVSTDDLIKLHGAEPEPAKAEPDAKHPTHTPRTKKGTGPIVGA